jgi:hypothetical protein
MKDLSIYIEESIFDIDDNVDSMDWVVATFQSLIDASNEEEFNLQYDLFKKKIENEATPVKLRHDLWLPHEPRKIYMMFTSDDELKIGIPKKVTYGTSSTAYRLAMGKNKPSNLQWTSGMFDQVRQAMGDKKVYYLPDSLKKSYNKAIKTMQ